MASAEAEDPLILELSQMAALAVCDEVPNVPLPLDKIAHVIHAAIETYLLFSARNAVPN